MNVNYKTLSSILADDTDLILVDLQIKVETKHGMRVQAALVGGRNKIAKFCTHHKSMGACLFTDKTFVIDRMAMTETAGSLTRLELDLFLNPYVNFDIDEVSRLVTAFANGNAETVGSPVPSTILKLPDGEPTVRECFERMDKVKSVKPIGSLEQAVAKGMHESFVEALDRKLVEALSVPHKFLK